MQLAYFHAIYKHRPLFQIIQLKYQSQTQEDLH